MSRSISVRSSIVKQFDGYCKIVMKLLSKKSTYASASDIARECGISVSTAYLLIRKMRQNGYAIESGKYGYVLASNATLQDDVHAIRRALSIFSGVRLATSVCLNDMAGRWPKAKDKQMLLTMTAPMTTNNSLFSKSIKTIHSDEIKRLF